MIGLVWFDGVYLTALSTIFQLYRGGGNQRTQRKPPTCCFEVKCAGEVFFQLYQVNKTSFKHEKQFSLSIDKILQCYVFLYIHSTCSHFISISYDIPKVSHIKQFLNVNSFMQI